MVKKFKYCRPGKIEFSLRSNPNMRITLKENEEVTLLATAEDNKVFQVIRSLGVMISDTVTEAPKPIVEAPKEVAPVVEELPVEETPVAEEEPEEKEDLMKKTRAELVELATYLGIEIPEKASKKVIVSLLEDHE